MEGGNIGWNLNTRSESYEWEIDQLGCTLWNKCRPTLRKVGTGTFKLLLVNPCFSGIFWVRSREILRCGMLAKLDSETGLLHGTMFTGHPAEPDGRRT